MPGFVKSLIDWYNASFVGRLVKKYGEDQGGELATLLAYRAFFSMFPIALALLTILGFVLRNDTLMANVQNAIISAFPSDPQLSESVTQALAGTRQNAGLFGLISFVGLVYGGSSLFGGMEMAFNTVFAVPPRPFWAQKGMAMLMIFVFAVLLVITLVTSNATTLIAHFSDQLFGLVGLSVGIGQLVLGWAISLVSGLILFMTLFWIVPNRQFRFKQVLPGALFASVAFLLFSQLFPLYASNLGNFNRYGASFGLAFLLLTWFGFVGQILLIGAELNSLLVGETQPATTKVRETAPLRAATVNRPRRLGERLAPLTPDPPASTPPSHGPIPRRALPLGAIGLLAGLYVLLGRLRRSE